MLLTKDAKLGEIIRQQGSTDCWMVVGKSSLGLQVINLSIKGNYSSIEMILPGQSDRWELDVNLKDVETFEKEEIKVREFMNGNVKDEEVESDPSPLSY